MCACGPGSYTRISRSPNLLSKCTLVDVVAVEVVAVEVVPVEVVAVAHLPVVFLVIVVKGLITWPSVKLPPQM